MNMLNEKYITPEMDVVVFEAENAIMLMSNEPLGRDDDPMDLSSDFFDCHENSLNL